MNTKTTFFVLASALTAGVIAFPADVKVNHVLFRGIQTPTQQSPLEIDREKLILLMQTAFASSQANVANVNNTIVSMLKDNEQAVVQLKYWFDIGRININSAYAWFEFQMGGRVEEAGIPSLVVDIEYFVRGYVEDINTKTEEIVSYYAREFVEIVNAIDRQLFLDVNANFKAVLDFVKEGPR